MTAALARPLVEAAVARALAEDLGTAGDLTSDALIQADQWGSAVIAARQSGYLCGTAYAQYAFALMDPRIAVTAQRSDGAEIGSGDAVMRVEGPLRGILGAERTALNFLTHLSGVATTTAGYVAAVAGTNARIACTRKTVPGLRAAQKYAVRCGGGSNHRFGLHDGILIKDNHIAACGGVAPAIARAKTVSGHMVKICTEADTLEQAEAAAVAGSDIVLLDNMAPATLAEAVRVIDGRAMTEASGGVSCESVRAIAESGIDVISIGALTHSAPALDLGLDLQAG